MGSALAIIGAALSIASSGYQVAMQEWGSKIQGEALSIARALANKIRSNEKLLELAQQAYATKSNSIISALYQGSGFGPRVKALLEAHNANENEYKNKVTTIRNQNSALQELQDKANNAYASTGTVVGNIRSTQEIADISQNINGGMNE